MIAFRTFVSAVMAIAIVGSAGADEEMADAKTIQRIQDEIELVPSLYAKHQGAPNLKGMPKFPMKNLAKYGIDDPQTAAKERKRWTADRDKYAKDHPLRASIFEAIEAMDEVQKLQLRLTLVGQPVTPKVKAALLQEQAPIGIAMFKLEEVLTQMKEADKERKAEKSPLWRMSFDFARARVEANVLFLYEYNYTLGAVRADKLPELRPGDAGWRITFHPNMHIMEKKVKRHAEDRDNRLRMLRKEHQSTPWAYFADVEGDRLLGMMWTPAKE